MLHGVRKSLEDALCRHELISVLGAWHGYDLASARVLRLDRTHALFAVHLVMDQKPLQYAICPIGIIHAVDRDTAELRKAGFLLRKSGKRGVPGIPWKSSSTPQREVRREFLMYVLRNNKLLCLHRAPWGWPVRGYLAHVSDDLLAIYCCEGNESTGERIFCRPSDTGLMVVSAEQTKLMREYEAFGMRANREDGKDATTHVRSLRKGRYHAL